MAMFIIPDQCPAPFIEPDPCTTSDYYVYRLVTGTQDPPGTIIARFPDNTFRFLKQGEYSVV